MVCYMSCGISAIFLFSMLYFSLTSIESNKLMQDFMSKLPFPTNAKYTKIIRNRRRIYLEGFTIGLILSLIAIGSKIYSGAKISWIIMMCLTGAITFLTTYFYYILSPKGEYIISELKTREERDAWLEIYKMMQFNYHLSLVLGIIAVMTLSYAFC